MKANGSIETLSVKVSNMIKKRISDGEWEVGDKIPNEQILAQEMNVSRTTIREAIKLLISAHILRIERGVGTFVLNKPSLLDNAESRIADDPENLMFDICEFRVYLEPIACSLAAMRATDIQIEEMKQIIEEMEKLSVKMKKNRNRSILIDRLATLEVRFHTIIYLMTGNIMFQRISQVMNNTVFETYMTEYYRSGIRSERLQYVDIHTEIYEAICARDPERAREASKRHMDITYHELVGAGKGHLEPILDMYSF